MATADRHGCSFVLLIRLFGLCIACRHDRCTSDVPSCLLFSLYILYYLCSACEHSQLTVLSNYRRSSSVKSYTDSRVRLLTFYAYSKYYMYHWAPNNHLQLPTVERTLNRRMHGQKHATNHQTMADDCVTAWLVYECGLLIGRLVFGLFIFCLYLQVGVYRIMYTFIRNECNTKYKTTMNTIVHNE